MRDRQANWDHKERIRSDDELPAYEPTDSDNPMMTQRVQQTHIGTVWYDGGSRSIGRFVKVHAVRRDPFGNTTLVVQVIHNNGAPQTIGLFRVIKQWTLHDRYVMMGTGINWRSHYSLKGCEGFVDPYARG